MHAYIIRTILLALYYSNMYLPHHVMQAAQ